MTPTEQQPERGEVVKRKCRWCGKTFRAQKGQAKRRGCPDCEPPLPALPEAAKQ